MPNDEAANRSAVVIDSAVRVEVHRKISILRNRGRTPSGRAELIAQGLLKAGSSQERLLELESSGSMTSEDLDSRWELCKEYFEDHMYRNVQAFVFNSHRRTTRSLAPEAARNAACDSLAASPAGRALLKALAETGVGHLDGFADPVAVSSLHRWLLSVYERDQAFTPESNHCNGGSFSLILEFDNSGPGASISWLAPHIPCDAATVLTKLIGLASVFETYFRFPLRLERQVKVGVYPAGGPCYTRHLDKYDFEAANSRTVTCLLYTDPDWPCEPVPSPGGELRVYPPRAGAHVEAGAFAEHGVNFRPLANRLLCFWSRTVFHEVLMSHAPGPPRFAVTLWIQSGDDWMPRGFEYPPRR
eukprot:gnl/TRDRNA2_/TRDRNA2_69440_c1_seq1.p1 gnl/TRDRNA2_/TRDRNA2_69440_c1~~gnl/TRDRNA2_/TRDRNA2_69440_c1_seq1.p1  ORF type:complete len:415 (-),score=30.23 gnl/TRDRNA2_/TRDRNA2_69440_c1_seq1:51-1127(-)